MREVNLLSVDLNLLMVFDAVMAEGSVSRAAERLHITQPAVSHSLRRLRQLLGDRLFLRTPGRMQPTSYAEAIAPRVRAVLREIQSIFNPSQIFDPAASQDHFSVGMTDYIASVTLPRLAQRLREQAPGVRLTALPAFSRGCIELIERGTIDMYVGAPLPDPPSFVNSAALAHEGQLCIGRRGHPAFAGGLDMEAFLAHPHLHISPWGEKGVVDKALEQKGAKRRIAMTIGEFLVAPAIVEESDMLAVLPRSLARMQAGRHAIELAELPFDISETSVTLTWHRRFDGDPALHWLRDQFAQVLDPHGEI